MLNFQRQAGVFLILSELGDEKNPPPASYKGPVCTWSLHTPKNGSSDCVRTWPGALWTT